MVCRKKYSVSKWILARKKALRFMEKSQGAKKRKMN